jgi:hypothetical protein
MYQWLVFTHVLAVFGFLLAHGVSAAVAFKVRGERDIARVRVLLDLSRGAGSVGNASLLVLLAAGITAGFMGGWWVEGWIWAALGLLVLISFAMNVVGSRPLRSVRQLLGETGRRGRRGSKVDSNTSPAIPTDQQLALALAAVKPWLLTAIGSIGLAAILWLMMFKPF